MSARICQALWRLAGSGAANLIGPDGDQTKQAEYHKLLAMQLMPARAVDNGLYVFFANQAGDSGNGRFPGLALAVDPSGRLIDEHLPTEGMTVTTVSRKVVAIAKRSASCTCDLIRPEVYDSPMRIGRTT